MTAPDPPGQAGGKEKTHPVAVAFIAAVAQVVAALIALVGPPATTSTGGSTTVSSAPAPGAACISVVHEYRTKLRLDPALLTALTTAGADGISLIDVDPDARRCGIDKDVLRALS
jgi:hypothetical protein